nr:EAL domain-containing protein [Limnobaculum eriocheiris]
MGTQNPVIKTSEEYDPRTRPWFREVNASRKPSWTRAYWDMDAIRGVSISYSSPVYNMDNRYVGVISSDIKLNRFNRYLQQIPNLGNGVIFIVNDNNEIISHSTIEKPVTRPESDLPEQDRAHLLTPENSESAIIRTIAPYLSHSEYNKMTLNIDHGTYYGRIVSFGKELGLHNWRIVVAIPQTDFVGQLNDERRITFSMIFIIFLLGVTLAWIILSRVTTPIQYVATQARPLARQKWSPAHQSRFELKEIKQLNDAFNEMSSTLSAAFSRLEHQVYYDSVTGLLSKEGLQKQLQTLSSQNNITIWEGLILLSLDNINLVNNSLGYQKGEALLCEFVKQLQEIIPPYTLLARVNDVEFAVCYPKNDGVEIDEEEINRYVHIYANSRGCGSEHPLFAGNVGLVKYEFDDQTLAINLRHASVALVTARKKGAGAYEIYRPEMMSRAVENTQMLRELNQAELNQELRVYFQPIIDLHNAEVIGAEALIRWHSKAYGVVPPYVFIPLAEDSGLILSIGRWVLRESCRQLALKIASGWPNDFNIHINVSARQLYQADFYDVIIATLNEFRLSACNLTIELTESVLLEKGTFISEQLGRIRALGISVAIDDFGSGFSSLSYLHCLQFDCLKIDRDFVSGILKSARNEAIISSVIRLAKGLGVPLIAEGIETKEVADRLYELGCPRGQGYYFGRPIPLDEWQAPGIVK